MMQFAITYCASFPPVIIFHWENIIKKSLSAVVTERAIFYVRVYRF